MKTSLIHRCRTATRLQLPAAVLITLLQRTPTLRFLAAVDEVVTATPIAAVLRSSIAAAAALGGLHTLAGATVLSASRPAPTVNVGAAIDPIAFTVTDTINIGSWKIGGALPPGVSVMATQGGTPLTGPGILDATSPGADDGYGGTTGGNQTTTPVLLGTPTQPGTYPITLQAYEFGALQGLASNTFTYTITVAGAATAPSISTQPTSQAATFGGDVVLSVSASGSPTIQWRHNGVDVSGGTGATLTLANTQPANAGLYTAVATNAGGTVTTTPAIVGLSLAPTVKAVGNGSEFASDIHHPNGNIFDQVLIDGPAVAVHADAGQVLRTSCIDKTDDIIQIEYAGAGTVSIVIDDASSPALPVKYNQDVNYVRGHVGIVVTGADETSNLSVFSVGRGTAFNQALFKNDVTYDGFADVSFIAISSTNGKFGGLRAANASFFATKGYTGVYAPGVEFVGPLFIGDINAFDDATPMIIVGSAGTAKITGGDLEQANGRSIEVAGLTRLEMAAGVTSHYIDASTPSQFFAAKTNKGHLVQNGTDVTAQVIVNPTP